MAKHSYIAFLEPAPKGGYGVSFPDLPGCVSFGDDLDDAAAQAREALSLHLSGMIEDDDALPAARGLQELAQAGELVNGFVYVGVEADVEDAGERVNVYLPKTLLRQIEAFGARTGVDNRSTFFRLAARNYIRTNSPGLAIEDLAAGRASDTAVDRAARSGSSSTRHG